MAVVMVCSVLSATAADVRSIDYPSQSIRLVVPFPAGGSADLVARVIAKPLSEQLGQPVVVDNKPGADGIVAADAVAKSKADGYTLYMATYGSMSAVQALHKNVPYDPVKDFTPISAAGKFSMFLFTHPDVPVKTLEEFVAYEHAHPGQMNYGTGNVASIVMSAQMQSQEHTHMTAIPYKGEVPAMNDFIVGRIHMMFATPVNALPFVKEGKLNVIAALSNKRSPLFPDTPTWNESGRHELTMVPWAGVLGPAHLPKDITIRVSRAINEVLERTDVQSEFAKLGFEAAGSSPEAFDTFYKKQLRAWHAAIAATGLKPE